MRAPSLRLTIPAVAAFAAAAFLPSLWAGFAADDYTMLSTVEALDGPVWAFERNDLGEVDGGHFYRPLWVLLNFAALELGGGGATAFHVVNVLLYALIAVEVLLLVRALTGRAGAALVAAAGFAVYPRHAESVGWVSGNTDLLATALGLAALLVALAPWPGRRRMLAAVALTALAAMAKESAFVLPALAALALWLRAEPAAEGGVRAEPASADRGASAGRPPERRLEWRLPIAMAAALVPVLILRTLAIGGPGGYSGDEPAPLGVLGAAATYVIAAFTPHQVEVLRHPWLAIVPLALVVVAIAAALRLRRHGEQTRLRTLWLGLGWFAVALLPVLGEPLDLNNATGERLLFLPSVGLAIALAALVPWRSPAAARGAAPPRRHDGRRGQAAAALLAALALAATALSLASAANWVTATDIADRTLAQALAAAPTPAESRAAGGAELMLLSIPESYRNAHVFTNSLDRAVQSAGRTDLRVSWCAPVHVRDERPALVRFTPQPDGATFLGRADPAAPFDFPVTGDPGRLTAGCAYDRAPRERDDSRRAIPGLRLRALARPQPLLPAVATLVFDGRDLRPLRLPDPG